MLTHVVGQGMPMSMAMQPSRIGSGGLSGAYPTSPPVLPTARPLAALPHPAAHRAPAANVAGGQGLSQGASCSSACVVQLDSKEQDSDLMERMGDGTFVGNPAAGRIPLVSLGCSCGPKLSFKDIGRGAETLPFDWARTTVEALISFISKDFEGFFSTANSYIKYTDENGAEWSAFRSPTHSFWHDDPFVPAMRERYTRRIKRLFSTDARTNPVLFVRSVAQTSEISLTGELLELLLQKFGSQSKLLLMVDFQGADAAGPCLVNGLDNLLIYFFDTASKKSRTAPYAEPLDLALNWVIGQQINARKLPDLAAAAALAVPSTWGMYGAGGVPAFV